MRMNMMFAAFLSLALFTTVSVASASPADEGGLAAQCPAFAAWKKAHHKPHVDHTAVKPSDPAWRKSLLSMARRDEKARNALLDAHGKKQQAALGMRMLAVDKANHKALAPMLDTRGFPTPAMVGHDGVAAAFLLVQHADSDPALQARMLPQLAKLHAKGEVPGQLFALLTDRVLRAQGKPQRYGTQFQADKAHKGVLVPQPMEDPAHVDARRASVDMPPLKDYACLLSKVYHQPVSLKLPAAAKPGTSH